MIDTPLFLSSADVFRWLSRFINLEQGQTPNSFRPERMEIMTALAGHPEKSAPVIHVAGSKGKGSVTGMISSVLEEAGLKTARYLSPHVTEYRERITMGDKFFDESLYLEAGNELRAVAETLTDKSKNEYRLFNADNGGGEGPTFFELLTLYFFLCARQGRCNAMAVETGMGGRLDPTNVVDPLVSVITVIELEHTEFLGNTLAAVAGEKAGIIKPHRPLILAEQSREALEVFTKTADSRESPLWYFPDLAAIKNLKVHQEGTDFTLFFKKPGERAVPLELSIPIPGHVQAKNAGLAVLALKAAFPFIDGDIIRRGLKNFKLPARFERIRDDPPVIIDGAHTPKSVELCVNTFTSLYGTGGVLIFGCAAGKNAEAMARLLLPCFSRVVITTPGTFKVSEPEQVYGIFTRILQSQGEEPGSVVFIKETEKAVRFVLDQSREQGLPVLGIGSFYLAAEIRAFAAAGRRFFDE
ncbi:MAG: bifunctional folylpolyglutamate synthase/dihydrofolate synthase [Spirochaetaceae bacterium]|jgi:dihydrofolate synthase/folylpolyglutamate synthase|nr:bifunctional folylpolyglutamate synthase/dihydrofolate synthase [Spirochaetaceae bacterium]